MGLTLCQQDGMHNYVLLYVRLLACLLVKREGKSKRAHASGLYGWGTGTELHKMHTAFLQALATC